MLVSGDDEKGCGVSEPPSDAQVLAAHAEAHSVAKAADRLGISAAALYKRLKALGVTPYRIPRTREQRALWGRVGAAIARSRHDPRALTAEARRTFLSKFEEQIRAEYPDLPEPEIQRRAGELRRAHFLRLAALSAEKRAENRRRNTNRS